MINQPAKTAQSRGTGKMGKRRGQRGAVDGDYNKRHGS